MAVAVAVAVKRGSGPFAYHVQGAYRGREQEAILVTIVMVRADDGTCTFRPTYIHG